MSKVIQDCIGLENSRHFSTDLQNKNQSRFGGPRFSRALGMRSLIGFLLWVLIDSYRYHSISSFLLIDRGDYFAFGFTTLSRKAL